MATPNMAAITASLERSLQNCSLNHQHSSSSSSSSSSSTASGGGAEAATPTLELNSEGSLPFHWEQCLDLKTGEVYYINWRTGMKATEDPRTAAAECGGYYSEEEEEEEDSSSYDSDGSSSESSPCSSRQQWSGKDNQENVYYQGRNENENNSNANANANSNSNSNNNNNNNNNVLVVAGCKSCLMYYMVPKQLEICPKCCGQLLHFDRSENGSS